MAELSWKHHTLIQALMSSGPLKESELLSIFGCITGKNPGSHQQLFNEYLRKINKELAYVQFELRGCRNQYDGSVYYGVVNNVADEQSKLGTKYSVPQIAFYKAVIEAIVQDATAQGCISNIEALNVSLDNQTVQESQGGQSHIPSALKNFSIYQKEKTLKDLVQDRWLSAPTNGNIGLGVRSFLDLRSWFRNNDVPSCNICNEAGVKADLCRNEGCTVRMHSYCLKKKFSQRKVDRACPGCGTEWQCPEANAAEAAATEEAGCGTEWQCPEENAAEAADGSTQNQVPSASYPKKRRLRSFKVEEDVSQTSEPVPDAGKRVRRSDRLR
ncbi:uncharacterized protein LOC131251088 [Magnolia sinica]|uniref:uncharacterized protein LOC131251088 n=1 Tax=Magnolia sinica TaxID=86752 RepID=UPI002659A8FE|nr:uncharacterized protein LOC131251088 [Magnolia sinica]